MGCCYNCERHSRTGQDAVGKPTPIGINSTFTVKECHAAEFEDAVSQGPLLCRKRVYKENMLFLLTGLMTERVLNAIFKSIWTIWSVEDFESREGFESDLDRKYSLRFRRLVMWYTISMRKSKSDWTN